MNIPKELLDKVDPVLTPIYVELYDECAFVVFDDKFTMLRPFEKTINGGLIFESVFEPIYFRRN